MVDLTIWEDIQEARKGKGEKTGPMQTWSWRGRISSKPEDLIPLEFREMEDAARQAVEEYNSTPASKMSRDLELKACDAILKYIIFNAPDLEKCGLRSISTALGISRSRANSLLTSMEWNGIVRSRGIGPSSPYAPGNLSKAMAEGYLQLTTEDIQGLAKMARIRQPLRALFGRNLVASLPEAKSFTETYIELWNYFDQGEDLDPELSDPIPRTVSIPFNPNQTYVYWLPIDDYDLIQRFLVHPLIGGLAKDIIWELDVPEKVTEQDIRKGLARVADKYLKMIRMTVKPLLDLIKTHGFEEAITMIPKAYMKDKLLRKEQDSKNRIIPHFTYHRGEKPPDYIGIIPEHGLVTEATQELTPSHLSILISTYEAACRFSESSGGDAQLIESCRKDIKDLKSQIPSQKVGEEPPSQGNTQNNETTEEDFQ